MHRVRTYVAAAALMTGLAGGGLLWAQPGADDPSRSEAQERNSKSTAAVDLTPQQMRADVEQRIGEMKSTREQMREVEKNARDKKDMIRLDCVEDKLGRADQLIHIAESARTGLVAAVGSGNRDEQQDWYNQVTIAHEKATVLRGEAEACVGEGIVIPGETDINPDGPTDIDDPTKKDPFDLADDQPTNQDSFTLFRKALERPTFASPFL